MLLNIIIDDYAMDLNVPNELIQESEETFARLDSQMDGGVQLGREWVVNPNSEQRCQIAAERLLGAIEGHNEQLALLSAAYIISRRPRTMQVNIDTSGEPSQTRFR